MSLPFEIFNGEKLEAGLRLFNSSNRAFRYGDGLFETIKVAAGKPLFIADHLERLENGLKILHLNQNNPGFKNEIELSILDFIKINEQSNLKLRLIVFRESAGFYTPKEDKISWHLSGEELDSAKFINHPQGLTAGLYSENLKSKSKVSTVKTLNCIVSILAGIHARNKGWDDALIINSDGNIIEATSSNLFIRIGKTILTPPLSDGCLDGVMRKNVIRLFIQHDFVVEEKSLSVNEIDNAQEMLVTNAIAGVRWIDQYNERKLQNTLAEKINSWLNE